MSKSVDTLFRRLARGFASAQDDVRARQMERYMRGAFTFYGIPAPTQLRIAREAVEGLPSPNEAELRSTSIACWKRTQREWQYFGCWYLRRNIGAASPAFLTTAERLVTTRSWWDTVDSLAVHVVGSLVKADPSLVKRLDTWIDSKNIWLARTAIIHQLSYKSDTDAERLFEYCSRRADDTEFFIRKAIGWALRQYSKTDERAVRRFVRDADLSGLSKREALKWIERGGDRPRARKRA